MFERLNPTTPIILTHFLILQKFLVNIKIVHFYDIIVTIEMKFQSYKEDLLMLFHLVSIMNTHINF